MSELTIIRTFPGSENYNLFEDLPKQIYEENSPRFILGNDPVNVFLEGCYVLLNKGGAVGRFAFYENTMTKRFVQLGALNV